MEGEQREKGAGWAGEPSFPSEPHRHAACLQRPWAHPHLCPHTGCGSPSVPSDLFPLPCWFCFLWVFFWGGLV